MTDNTKDELEVEVPLKFDAKTNAIRALVFGLQKGMDHLLQSYTTHHNTGNPKVSVKVPTVIVDHNSEHTETDRTVYEDTSEDQESEDQ